jgi:WbqC-like protein family
MIRNSTAILPISYLGSIDYYSKLINYSHCVIDYEEHFVKQTSRSRCFIASANGAHILSVPILKRRTRKPVKEVKISYDEDWRKIHWRTLEASYRSSPFFEFYEDDLIPYFTTKKYDYLVDLTQALQSEICSLLKINLSYDIATEYIEIYENADDFRNYTGTRTNMIEDSPFLSKPYIQVFENKNGFLPNLSVLDLLFNQGPKAKDYLTL